MPPQRLDTGKRIGRKSLSHAADKRWREVILLTTSMLDYHNVTRLFNIWCVQLQEMIQTSEELTAFVQWAAQYQQSISSTSYYSMRAMAMTQALWQLISTGYDTLIRDDGPALSSAFTNDVTSDLASDLARASEYIRVSDIAVALARASARATDLARTVKSDRASARANVLANAIASARASIEVSFRMATYETNNQSNMAGKFLSSDYNVAHAISLTSAWLHTLEAYLDSTTCLLDCLEVATVDDHLAIVKQLLLPPSEAQP